jgi:hypothetical protein
VTATVENIEVPDGSPAPPNEVVDGWTEVGVSYTSTDGVVNVIEFDTIEEAGFHQHFFGGKLVERQVHALAWKPVNTPE